MTGSVFGARYARLRQVLVDARRRFGLTQVELAAKLGRPQSFVSKVKSGERRIDVVELLQYAEAVGADPAEVVREVVRVADAKAGRGARA
jgi:transcriptional regulator with XRE-family HTH domain